MEEIKMKLLNNSDCDVDLIEIKDDLLKLFKSPNPLYIYSNSKNIKDKFSMFLLCLSKKIEDWFNIDDSNWKTFMMSLYSKSGYDKIWINFLENFLRDSKNFDLLNYIYFVKTINKEKQYLARWLFQMYLWKKQEDIEKMLNKYNSNIKYAQILKIYNDYSIKDMFFDINLREDFVEHFIEKVYLNLYNTNKAKAIKFLDNFILKISKNINFTEVAQIFLKIVKLYHSSFNKKYIIDFVESNSNKDIKFVVDEYIINYNDIRWSFYHEISIALSNLDNVWRWIFWAYIRTKIIDLYYSDIKKLFYDYSSSIFMNKEDYTSLRWEIKIIPSISWEREYLLKDYNEIKDLKEIIIQIQDNLFSFFLLPVIYYTISEKLTMKKKDLYKMKYTLLYIFSSNYSEYKKIYMFFNQLEAFLNYDNSSVIGKIQVSFSLILFVFIALFISYLHLPIWVFIWIFTLFLIKYVEVMYPNFFYKLRWNIWVKFFAILFLSVSSYYWMTNFDKVKQDSMSLSQKIEFLWTIQSREIIDSWFKYLNATIKDFKKE